MENSRKSLYILISVVVAIVIYVFFSSDETRNNAQIGSLSVKNWETEKGAKVIYVHAPELPMVDIRIVFDAGSARDAEKPGLSTLTNLLLDHGAGDLNTIEVAERFEDIGAEFSTSSYKDMAVVSLRSLTDENILPIALDSMALVLQKPSYLEDELELERARILVALKKMDESASNVASMAYYKSLYVEHPYATPSIGTVEGVTAISIDDITDFYKKYYVAANALIVIVGAVDREQAETIAEQLMDGLDEGDKAEALPEVDDVDEMQTVNIAHSSTQTHLLVGQVGMKRGDEDYFALYVGNHILGGSGFSSLIVKEIREDRGLAYSSYSYFSAMRENGPFTMGLQTKNEQADEALTVLLEVLNKFIEEGPTEEQLANTKKNILGGFPFKMDSNKKITEYMAMIGFYNLPLDYLDTFNDNVSAVTVDQIKDAYERRIDPEKLIIIKVGPVAEENTNEKEKE